MDNTVFAFWIAGVTVWLLTLEWRIRAHRQLLNGMFVALKATIIETFKVVENGEEGEAEGEQEEAGGQVPSVRR